MRLYIAGPMWGLPDFNYPAFFRAADQLASAGHDPINPARPEGRSGCRTWLDYIRASLRDLAYCDGVALLPGWANSRGALLERDIARGLDLPVKPLSEWLLLAEALAEAARGGGGND